MKGIKAGGSTSCGTALMYLARKRQYVEQVILISDEEITRRRRSPRR
jgi:hypothetical protein